MPNEKSKEHCNEAHTKSLANEAKPKQQRTLEVVRSFKVNKQAMLQALRVILDLPLTPIVLKEDEQSQ
jgi:hypothetical protein